MENNSKLFIKGHSFPPSDEKRLLPPMEKDLHTVYFHGKIIADTCIWIDFFRTKSKNSNLLKNFISKNLVVGNGIILSELLQGTKTDREREIVLTVFEALDYLEITRDIWGESGKLAGQLRSRGKTIPLSDILLACCARKYRCRVFTIDKHFQEIPDIILIDDL